LIQLENNIILVCEYFEGRSLRDILRDSDLNRGCDINIGNYEHVDTMSDISAAASPEPINIYTDTNVHNRTLNHVHTSSCQHSRSAPFTLQTFLPLAIQLSLTLGQIHQQNIIHKDLSCGNILYNEADGTCMIIDFGLASVLSSENKKNNILTGTIGYISPEQTGRSNKKLDYRTDLYSLGTYKHIHTYIYRLKNEHI
jgi:serine/threonine protein kinase